MGQIRILRENKEKTNIYLYTGTQRYCKLEPRPPGAWKIKAQVQRLIFSFRSKQKDILISLYYFFFLDESTPDVKKRAEALRCAAKK